MRELETYQPSPSTPIPDEYFDKGYEAEKDKDFIQAKVFYEKASERGHSKAPSYLGTMFLKGLGNLPQDKALAYQLFLKGANNGHVRAMFNLAAMLEKGNGITKDVNLAIYWYEQAGKQGDK